MRRQIKKGKWEPIRFTLAILSLTLLVVFLVDGCILGSLNSVRNKSAEPNSLMAVL